MHTRSAVRNGYEHVDANALKAALNAHMAKALAAPDA